MRFGFTRYSSEYGLVSHHAERPRLLIDRARRLNGRVDKLAQRLFIDRLGGEFTHRAPRVDSFLEVHVQPALLIFNLLIVR